MMGRVILAATALLLLAFLGGGAGCGGRETSAEPSGTIYVANEDDNTVSVIDAASRSVTATIPVGKWPHYIALDPAGRFAFVTCGDSSSVSVIDTAANRVTRTIEGMTGDPQQIAIHPSGKLAYIPCYDEGNVRVVDLVEGKVKAAIPVGESPQSIAISSDGKRVYVLSLHSSEGAVIDTASNTVAATFPTGEGSCGIAISPDGRSLYIGGHGAGMWMAKGQMNEEIRVFNAATFTQQRTIRCGIMPIAVRFSQDGNRAYIASHGSGELHIIDTASGKASSVKVGSDCRDMAITAVREWVYVSNRGSSTVSMVDAGARRVVATIQVGRGPVGIAIKESGASRS